MSTVRFTRTPKRTILVVFREEVIVDGQPASEVTYEGVDSISVKDGCLFIARNLRGDTGDDDVTRSFLFPLDMIAQAVETVEFLPNETMMV